MFREEKEGQAVWNVVGIRERKVRHETGEVVGVGSHHRMNVNQMRLICMVTNPPQVSIVYNREVYLLFTLHVHCGLAANFLCFRTQVDGTAPTWDTIRFLEEGKKKDYLRALQLLHGSGCATCLGPSKLHSQK